MTGEEAVAMKAIAVVKPGVVTPAQPEGSRRWVTPIRSHANATGGELTSDGIGRPRGPGAPPPPPPP
jgi:hypothetical protein